MRAIKTSAIITGIRSKIDRSLGLSVSTPELSSEQKVVIMDLQGRNIDMLIVPADEPMAEVEQVDKEIQHKTQAQRIRAVLYLRWEREKPTITFDEFYRRETETYIEQQKRLLDGQ